MIIASGAATSRGRPAANGERHDYDGGIMTDRTYRVTEIVGTSTEGIDPAIRNGLHRAGETLRHLDWFEVTQIRGQIEDGQVAHYQVGMKVGFRLEDA
jgi:flavin-binding protein dodecin